MSVYDMSDSVCVQNVYKATERNSILLEAHMFFFMHNKILSTQEQMLYTQISSH